MMPGEDRANMPGGEISSPRSPVTSDELGCDTGVLVGQGCVGRGLGALAPAMASAPCAMD